MTSGRLVTWTGPGNTAPKATHLLFGDTPYLYSLRFRRREKAGPGQWHKELRSGRTFDGSARALLFCGLLPVSELVLRPNVSELAATRLRLNATCPRCLAALDRYLEQGRAAIAAGKKGPFVHLLFKPSPAEIAAIISRDEPLSGAGSRSGASTPRPEAGP